jgi:hypothetical protein
MQCEGSGRSLFKVIRQKRTRHHGNLWMAYTQPRTGYLRILWHVRLRNRRYLVTARQQLRKKALLGNGWPLNNAKAVFSMGSGPRL